MQKQSARIKCKNNLLKSASDMVCLVKTTTYAQNNIIKGYFHIFKAQSSKSGWRIVESMSKSISMNGIVVSEV